MRTRSGAWQAIATVMLAGTFAACGGGPICLNCSPSGSPTPGFVTVMGSVAHVTNPSSNPNLTVAICVNDAAVENPNSCNNPALVAVDSNNNFVHTGVEPGSEQIFFTQNPDNGDSPDVAKLSDPQDQLGGVKAGSTVTLGNVQIVFNAGGTGSATANISVATPIPTPIGTPTPVPTPS